MPEEGRKRKLVRPEKDSITISDVEEKSKDLSEVLGGEDLKISSIPNDGIEDEDNSDESSEEGSDNEENGGVDDDLVEGSDDDDDSVDGSDDDDNSEDVGELEWESGEDDSNSDQNVEEKIENIPSVSNVKIGEIKDVKNSDNKAELTDEYAEGDTSDEEDILNTIGNIPVNWYDEYDHIGYDWDGKKILKPERGDQLDEFLKKIEDPDFWRKVRNPQTGQDVILSDDHINLIKRLESKKIPDETFNDYAPWIEWFSSEVMEMPLRKFPEHKKSFLPSREEMKKVSKYVHALKMGWMKTRKAMKKKVKKNESEGPQFYMLWKTDDLPEEIRRIENHIPAPKRALPGHAESYNPPEEYLFNEFEMKKWNRERKSLGNKKLHFVPQKFNSLREVPAYRRFIRERFMRCLDLYMCPRAIKMKLTIEPEELVPQLPSPADLQPFPTAPSIYYKGHTDFVRSISLDSTGQFMASASDDGTVKIWEVTTGRCLKSVELGGTARCISWNPSSQLCLLAVAVDRKVYLLNPRVGCDEYIKQTDELLDKRPYQDKETPARVEVAVQWEYLSEGELFEKGVLIILHHFKEVKQVQWHRLGDYVFSLMPEGENRSIIVHHLSRGRSQIPFNKARGLIQAATFHPTNSCFIVATQRNVRIYDLVKQEMIKKLITSSKWISDLAMHPGGDNLLVGTYDRKVLWFDLELSTKPYKTLSLHSQAVRGVAFHKRYPLFATVSDDQSLILSHGMVYSDLLKNALIVPLKRFSCHDKINDFSLLGVTFHPHQPWVFTSGADGNIVLYS